MDRQDHRATFLVFVVLAVVLALVVAIVTAAAGVGAALGPLAALIIVGLIVWRPVIALYLAAASVAVVEQGPLPIPIFTDRLPIFQWPMSLAGQPERPIGYLLLFTFAVVLSRRFINREKLLDGGALIVPFVLFMLCVAGGVAHGLANGNPTKIIVVEVRPFWYLFLSYLLATNLVTNARQVRTFVWIGIVGAGIKGLQGLYIVFVALGGNTAAHRDIMAHEDSFFFVGLLLLVILFRLHHTYRPQFYVALLELPFVCVTLVANNRRADYVALLAGIAVAWALIYQIKPKARTKLVVGMVVAVVLLAGYTAAFQHTTGTLGQPARALMSVFDSKSATAEDANSNRYRVMENYDLRFTVRQSPVIGWGFGRPFLQPYVLPNILALDPYYNYVPHNTIYWVWMRLGALGFAAFWYLVGSIIVRGCITARRLRSPYLQVVAVYVVAITVMEIIVAFADYQLYFFRNVIYVGLLAGVLMRLPAIDDPAEARSEGRGASTALVLREERRVSA